MIGKKDKLKPTQPYFVLETDNFYQEVYLRQGISHFFTFRLEESKEIIFFPTSSLKNVEKCYWICLKHIDKYYKIEDKIRIEFKKNITLNLNLSYGSLDNQILRATRLESVLRNRKNNI